MIRRITPLLLATGLVLTACNGESAETTTTSSTSTTSTTTTTLPPTTTTTLPPRVEVDGAPPGLADLVQNFYDYAMGVSEDPPAVPDPVLAGLTEVDGEPPVAGSASVGVFGGEQVAVVEAGDDMFLAVGLDDEWRIVGGHWPTIGIGPYFGEGPRHVAVVGSDARTGQDALETRADSIHFVGLDGQGGGGIIGLPRDSFVPVPGIGRTKVTGSLALGGPDVMMATFTDLTGLPLEGYVLTGFNGFKGLIDTVLGGVTVEVPFAINDRWAHVDIPAGEQELDGAEALGFARARKTVPNGDFTRSEHQGVILLGAAKAVARMGMSALPGLMELAEPYIATSLTPEQLLTFSAMAITSDLDSMPNVVAPGSPGSAGGASVVFLANSAADLWADLADGRLGS